MATATTLECEATEHQAPTTRYHRLVRLCVRGGFLDGERFDFADGLNCLIGARGTGKTTALELIRYALDALPQGEAQRAERRRIESLVRQNLDGGQIRLEVETKEGIRLLISRSWDEEPIVLTPDGTATDLTVRAGGIFRADIFSQNEVERIADRPGAQLTLLDSFEAEPIDALTAQIRQVRAQLQANGAGIGPLEQQLDTMTEELGALPAIEAKLQTFAGDEKDGDDGEVNTAHRHKALRDRQQRLAGDLVDVLRDARGQVTRLRQWLPQRLAEITSSETAGGPNQELVARIQREAVLCNDAVDRFWQQAEARIATAEQAIEDHAQQLSLAHRRQEVAFHELMERHQEAQGQAAERVRLEKARNNLLARRRQRDAVQQELTELRRQRHQLHQRLSELEEQRFNIRESVAGRINAQLAPAIRVNLVQYGDRTLFRQFLEKSLKGHRIHHGVVAGKLADHFWPSELARLVAEEDVDTLVDRGELRCEQAERAVAALSHAETLAELETVELLDQPEIALCDGETYKDCAMLSTGQKCTAILPILLMDSDRPLLVDQPEDNLDNRFVFEAVVDSIRKIKVTRQLIFVTHNPNIPVLGDAERVFVLDSDGARARMAGVGSVDECKDQIVTLLEGGEEAFRQRRARYDY